MTAPSVAETEVRDLHAVVAAVVAEQRASDAWAATKGQPFPVQLTAFQTLQAAYAERVKVVQRWIAKHPDPEPDDGPGLFGGGDDAQE